MQSTLGRSLVGPVSWTSCRQKCGGSTDLRTSAFLGQPQQKVCSRVYWVTSRNSAHLATTLTTYLVLQSGLEVPLPADSKRPHRLENHNRVPTLTGFPGDGRGWWRSLLLWALATEWKTTPVRDQSCLPQQFSSLTQACLFSPEQPIPTRFLP